MYKRTYATARGYAVSDFADLAAEWNQARNGVLRPEELSYGSGVPVWWRCRHVPGHEWRATPNNRTHGRTGCPFCAGRRVSAENNLAVVAPQLAACWHPSRNGTLLPSQIVAGSSRRVWWKCPAGDDHEWSASPHSRLKNRGGCPYCHGLRVSQTNNLAARSAALAAEWHPWRNGAMRPEAVVAGSNRVVWWRCREGHEWRASLDNRFGRGTRCPRCRAGFGMLPR